MKFNKRTIVIILLVFLGNSYSQVATHPKEKAHVESYDKKSLYVKLRCSLSEFKNRTKCKGVFRQTFEHIKSEDLLSIFSVKFETTADALSFSKTYGDSTNLVEYIEYQPIHRTNYVPNDHSSKLWHLNTINAFDAWEITKGSSQITIAIVDDAVDIDHPDLANICIKNAAEIPGNGIDDDNNGYWDDYDGWGAKYLSPEVRPFSTRKLDFTHGTHCAGIAAGHTDNSQGIASIGFGVQILPVSCADSMQPGHIFNGLQGIEYAIVRGVDIISLSWGGLGKSKTGQAIINYAHSKGILIVAAAGNNNFSNKIYPAAYDHVIAVSATDSLDKKAYFSNYGSWVDISAPGVNIYSSISGSGYNTISGTSMATPLVAGLCGLMKSRNNLLSPDEIESCLKNSAKNIDPLNALYSGLLGSGRIDAEMALRCVRPITAKFTADKDFVCPMQSVSFKNLSSVSATQFKWYFEGAMPPTSSLENPIVTYNSTGTFNVKLVASNNSYKDSIEYKNFVKVEAPRAILSGQYSSQIGEMVYFQAKFTGAPPFNTTISNGSESFTFSELYSNPAYLPVEVKDESVFRITSFEDGRCKGQYLGLGVVDTIETRYNSSCKYPVDLFTIKLEGSKDVTPHEMITLKDGNFLIAGIQSNSYIGGDDIILSKVDQKGKLLWSKVYGTKNTEYGFPVSIAESTTGLYLGASVQPSGRWYKGYLSRLDKSGNTIWAREFQNPQTHDAIRGLAVLPNEDIIASGTSAINNLQAGQIMRFDKTGKKEWGFSLDITRESEHFTASILLNNSIYSFGHANYGAGVHTGWLTKTDLSGNVIWKKDIDLPWVDCCIAGVPSPDGGSIIVQGNIAWKGSSQFGNRDFYICRVDTNGTVIWSKTFGSTGNDYCTNGVYLNGYYYVAGLTSGFKSGTPLPFLVKLDINGNIIWQKVYGDNSKKYNLILLSRCLTTTPDGGLLFAIQDVLNNKHTALFKFNQCGETTCESENITFGIDTRKPATPTSRGSRNQILNDVNYTPAVQKNSNTITSMVICAPQKAKEKQCNIIPKIESNQFCVYDTMELKDKSYEEFGRNIISRIWQLDNQLPVSDGPTFRARFNIPGNHSIKLILFSDTPNICSDTFVLPISVNNNIKGSIKSYPPIICSGDSSILEARVSCGVNPIDVNWTGSNFSKDDYTAKVSPNINTWYTFSARDKNGDIYKDSILVLVDQSCCKNNASFLFSKSVACIGDSIYLSNTSSNSSNSILYSWEYFFDGKPFMTYTGTNPPPFFTDKVGIFRVVLIASGGCSSDTGIVEISCLNGPPLNIGLDTVFCEPISFQVEATPVEGISYEWIPTIGLSNSDIINPIISLNSSITYHILAKNQAADCISIDTIKISIAEKPNLPNDTFLCEGNVLQLFGPSHNKFYWENNSSSNPRIISDAGLYILTDSQTYCATKDSILVTKHESPIFDLDSIGILCNAEILEINPRIDSTGLSALWENGHAYFQRSIINPGKVFLTVSNDKCSWQDSMNVEKNTSPNAFIGTDTALCEGSNLIVQVKPQNAKFSWSDGSVAASLSIKHPGTYWLVARNLCGKDSQAINISLKKCSCTIYTPNVFSPNLNQKNEVFIQVSDCNIRDYNLKIYNRWGEKLFESFDQSEGWNGQFMEQPCHDGVYVYIVTGIMEFDTYEEILNKKGVVHILR